MSGIIAQNDASSSDLVIDVADVSGSSYGIKATNLGRGALSISSTGDITANGTVAPVNLPDALTGIEASNSADGTDLTVDFNNATGQNRGIRAINNGTGMITITSEEDAEGNRIGTAQGRTGDGIFAQNAASGIGMTIAVNDAFGGTADAEGVITGGFAGIVATNRGTAAVPEGSSATNGLTISVNNATGGQFGIRARNEGTGALTITTSGQIEG